MTDRDQPGKAGNAADRSGPLWRRWIGRACLAFGVAVAAWLAFGALWRHDPADNGPLDGWLAFAALCSQTFAFHAGLGVAAALVIAAAARARVAGVLLVLLAIPTLGLRGAGLLPADPAGVDGEGLTVFSANLLFGRGDPDALLAQIRDADPDVIVFQEYTAESSAYEDALAAGYPHRVVWPREDAFGQAVFSRVAFTSTPELWRGPEGSTIPMIACEIEVRGRRIAVWNVHTLPPTGWRNTISQRAMVAWIGERVSRVMSGADAPDGLIVAGDFNAPFGTNHLRELRHAGLREAHEVAGRGAGATWPRLHWMSHFPGIRLDHVMYTGGLIATDAHVGADFGSDHRPVSARLSFRDDVHEP